MLKTYLISALVGLTVLALVYTAGALVLKGSALLALIPVAILLALIFTYVYKSGEA